MEKTTIILNKMEYHNFKGIKHKVIEFSKETSLYGDNGTGKTTAGADGLPWLFFGKNAADEAKFNVKTLDSQGVRIPNVETSVKGWFTINGTEEVFERILFEKWVKQHGETTKEYKGDETKFMINAAPKKKKDFDYEVGNIISAGLFKLLSNPLEFNRLAWEKRREALIKMAGNVELEATDANLLSIINSGKTLETYKAELKGKIRLHNDNLVAIPDRIDEANRFKPEVLNWTGLEAQIKAKNDRIVQIDGAIANEAEKQRQTNQKQTETQKWIGEKQLELQKLENDLKLEANKDLIKLKADKTALDSDFNKAKEAIKTNTEFIAKANGELVQFNEEKKSLLAEYYKIKERKFDFDESKSICPTCKQSLPSEEIEETKVKLLGNFNTKNANDLELNLKKGTNLKTIISEQQKSIEDAQSALDLLNKEVPELSTKIESIVIEEKPVDFSMEKEWNDLSGEIEILQKQISKPMEITDNSIIKVEKAEIGIEVKALEKSLNTKDDIVKADKRIAELQEQQKTLGQQIAGLEKEQSIVLSFEKAKMNMLEEKVNSMFQLVKFRMFEPQKNGGEKPDCVTLVDGVPYSDLNTAAKINAGIDIINVLSEHFQTFVPIVVDNRESVTELLPVKTQIINLFKDSNYKTLTVK